MDLQIVLVTDPTVEPVPQEGDPDTERKADEDGERQRLLVIGAERRVGERCVLEDLAHIDVFGKNQIVQPLLEGSALTEQRVELDLQGRPVGLR